MARPKNDVIVEDGAVYVLRAGTAVYVKTADICSMTGKSNQWIGQLVAQGTLHKRSTPHGSLFDVAEAVRAYCSMLEAALLARDVDFEDIRATAELQLGRNEQGRSRVLKMVIRCSVRVNERDEAMFRRVEKMMAQGCLVTGSLHDGIPMEYELEPTFFEE